MKINFTNFKKLIFLPLTFALFQVSLQAQSFTEQAANIGINHAYNDRALLGGGAAFFDYDNDGFEDLYLTGGANKDDLYKNNGDGTFTKIIEEIGLEITAQYNTIGICTGDVNNDGFRDIFVTTWERYEGAEEPIARNLLFANNGDGSFSEQGEAAGITHEAFSQSATFLDYDQDGDLDIYVANHIKTAEFTYDNNGVIDGFAHECFPNFLYRNDGDFSFTEIAVEQGLASTACSSAVLSSDFDQDGDDDILLANDFGNWVTPNQFFQNNQASPFNDFIASSEAPTSIFGYGVAAGDYDNDLDMDYYVTSIGKNILMENSEGSFSDATDFASVGNEKNEADGLNTTGFGAAFLDVNNDGWEDLYVANGRIPTLAAFATTQNDPDKLFLNNGDKTFSDKTEDGGISNMLYSRGIAYSDFDLDGDLDLFVVALDELGGISKFYINETENDNTYAQIQLTGTGSNWDAFGSKVWLYASGETYFKELSAGSTYASQNSSILHFGLGTATKIDSIKIEWPNGLLEVTPFVEINTRNSYVEGMITSTDFVSSPNIKLTLAPNPTTGEILLQGSPFEQVEIYNVQGLLVQNIVPSSSNNLDISNLAKGMYFLKIKVGEQYITKKVVKQ